MEITQELISRRISLKPNETANIDYNLIKKLKDTTEGRCGNNVYIAEIKGIKQRSNGVINNLDFKSIDYDIIYLADVIKVNINDIIFGCEIEEITPTGIFLKKDKIFKILVNRYLPENFTKTFKVGQMLNIRILGYRCILTTKNINVVGVIHHYYMPETRLLMLKLSYPQTQDPIKELAPSFKTHKEELEGVYDNLIPFERVERVKHEIDGIDPNIWDFYKMFLNPTELVYPKTGYASKDASVYQGKKKVPSRAYFKLLEIFHQVKGMSKFLQMDKMNIACLAEAPGGFIRAIGDWIGMRNIQSIHTISYNDGLNYSNDLLSKASDDQKKIKITYGNLFNTQEVSKFVKEAGKCQLITADGGVSTKEVDYDQEKELFKLILAEIYIAFQICCPGGTFILKIFDTNTKATVDLLWLLNSWFEEVIIYKPQMSRPANSERYLICSEFKGNVPQGLWERIRSLTIIPDAQGYINGLLPDSIKTNSLYLDFSNQLRGYGFTLSELQYKKIREIIEIIKLNNYKMPKPEVFDEYLYYQKLCGEKWARLNYLKDVF